MSSEGLPVDGVIGTDIVLGARSTQQATDEAKSSLSADSAAQSADAAFKFSRQAKEAVSGADSAAERAEAAAENAQNIADANTYYITPEDPDGTIAGIAGTPDGKMFRVAIQDGAGVTISFNYYKNESGTAKFINSDPSKRFVEHVNDSVVNLNQRVGIKLYDQTMNVRDYYVVAGGVDAGKIKPTATSPTIVTYYPVESGQTYRIESPDFRGDYFAIALKVDSNVTGDTLGLLKLSGTGSVREFTVPADSPAKFAFMNVMITNGGFDITQSVTVQVDVIKQVDGINIYDKYAREYMLDDNISLIEDDSGQIYNILNNRAGYYVRATGANAGDILPLTGTVLNTFPISAGKTYTIQASSFEPNYFAVTLKNDNQVTGPTLGLVTLTGTGNTRSFTVPSGSAAKFAFMNVYLPGPPWDIRPTLSIVGPVQKMSALKSYGLIDTRARDLIAEIDGQKNSPIKGKSWAAIGDSITAENFRTKKNYHAYVKENVGGMDVYNYGISGTGYYGRSGVADTITENPDYLTVFFGTNDWGQIDNNKPLGAFLDTGTATISGCINTCLLGLITKFYSKKVAVFTPLPRSNNWGSNAAPNAVGYTLEQLSALIQRYAAHYSIPCLDLYHESNLPVYVPAGNSYYFTYPGGSAPDGLHPNDAGHIVMAAKIQAFLESI
ncbi:TPA: SGNH/GDSL hydrolase family protein [Serratia marcescens]